MLKKVKKFFKKNCKCEKNKEKYIGWKWCQIPCSDEIAANIRIANNWPICDNNICSPHLATISKFKEFIEKRHGTYVYKAYVYYNFCDLHLYVLSKMSEGDREYLIMSIARDNYTSGEGIKMLNYYDLHGDHPEWLPPNKDISWAPLINGRCVTMPDSKEKFLEKT